MYFGTQADLGDTAPTFKEKMFYSQYRKHCPQKFVSNFADFQDIVGYNAHSTNLITVLLFRGAKFKSSI